MLEEEDCNFISNNRELPEIGETQDEKMTKWLKALERAKEEGEYGEKYVEKLQEVREESGKKTGGGSKYVKTFGSESVVRMMLVLRSFGWHFLYSDGLRV